MRECNKELTARRYGLVTLASLLFVATFSIRAAETANTYKPPSFKPSRAEDGKPDLQGIWTNSSVTGLERPSSIQKLVLTPDEAARWVATDELVEHVTVDPQSINPKTGLLDGTDLAAGHGYNGFW